MVFCLFRTNQAKKKLKGFWSPRNATSHIIFIQECPIIFVDMHQTEPILISRLVLRRWSLSCYNHIRILLVDDWKRLFRVSLGFYSSSPRASFNLIYLKIRYVKMCLYGSIKNVQELGLIVLKLLLYTILLPYYWMNTGRVSIRKLISSVSACALSLFLSLTWIFLQVYKVNFFLSGVIFAVSLQHLLLRWCLFFYIFCKFLSVYLSCLLAFHFSTASA